MTAMRKQRVVIFGADGMLGSAVATRFKTANLDDRSFELVESTELDCDITEKDETIFYLMSLNPDVVINCAGYTDVDGCEAHTTTAYMVNADGPAHLAEGCFNTGARLIHISTEYVYDGTKQDAYTEQDSVNPLSEYGKSKLLGEKKIARHLEDYVILRTSWLYGPGGKNFVDTILRLADERDEITMVNDQRGAPTFTIDLANGIYEVFKSEIRGIYHLTNSDFCTWYDLASRVLELKGKSLKMQPIASEQLNRPASRPMNSVLDCSKIERDASIRLRAWGEALKDFLK